MDAGQYIREAAAYTRATLVGKWSRWLIIVLLGLPWLVLRSLVESSKIIQGTTIHWNLIPWDEAGLLIITGLLCNFFLLGYFVRLMKGYRAPPEFDNWLLLLRDGIKVQVIPLVWLLVPLILAFIEYSIASSGLLSGTPAMVYSGLFLIIVLVVIQIAILFYAVTYGNIGAIRFARTGTLRQAFASVVNQETLRELFFHRGSYRLHNRFRENLAPPGKGGGGALKGGLAKAIDGNLGNLSGSKRSLLRPQQVSRVQVGNPDFLKTFHIRVLLANAQV